MRRGGTVGVARGGGGVRTWTTASIRLQLKSVKMSRGAQGHKGNEKHHHKDWRSLTSSESWPQQRLCLGFGWGATNGNEMVHHHVLEIGPDEGSLLVRGIDEVVAVVNKI